MNREILFRGKAASDNKWVSGYYCIHQENGYHLLADIKTLNWRSIIIGTLGQYTGLQDKNGKKIFVGDILRFDNGDMVYLDLEDWLEVSVISIGDPELEDQWRDLYRIERAEIIGNIHDNPELIND